MTTAVSMIQQAIAKSGVGIYLPNTTVLTAIPSTTTFTAPQIFMRGQYSNNSFLGWAVWRPGSATAAGADFVRHVASIAPLTGVATIDVAWTDQTIGSEDAYLFSPGIEPYMIVNAANLALRLAYFPNLEPLSIKPVGTGISDAGFQNTATAAYTASGTTWTKVNTANSENVFRGIGSGRTLNAGYIYQQFAIDPLQQVYIHAMARLASGTNASVVIRDATNSVDIGTAVAHASRKFNWIRRVESQTATGKLMDVRLTAVGATDDVYWNALTVMPAGTRRIILDTRWDTAFKMPSLAYVKFGTSQASNVYDAFATELEPLAPDLYKFDIEKPGANPSAILFDEGIEPFLQYPIYIDGRRSYADLYSVTMADVTTDIPIDIDLWSALFRLELFSMGEVRRKFADWQIEYERALFDAGKADQRVSTGTKRSSKPAWSNFGRVSN